MSLPSDQSKMLKELSPEKQGSVIVRIISLISTSKCANGSFRFSCQVWDGNGTQANVVCYHSNRDVCDRYEKMMVLGEVFKLRRFTLKAVKPRFKVGDIGYDIMLTTFSTVVRVDGDEAKCCPCLTYTYIPVSSIADHAVNSVISCRVYVVKVGEFIVNERSTCVTSTREITVADENNDEITVTLWNDRAKNCSLEQKTVILIQRAKVSAYQGLSLQVNSGTNITVVTAETDETKQLFEIVKKQK